MTIQVRPFLPTDREALSALVTRLSGFELHPWRRADENQPGILAGLGEVSAFSQEAIAGVDGLRAAFPGDRDDFIAAQVRIARGGRAQQISLISKAHMQRLAVGL